MKHQSEVNVRGGIRRPWIRRAITALGVISLSVTGLVSTGSLSSASTKQTLNVWVDSTRVPAVQDYEKVHPNVTVHMNVYDGDAGGDGTFLTKVSLFNEVKGGWPDVVWSDGFADIASLADPQLHYAARLDATKSPLVSKSILNNFAKGSNAVCEINGHLYCLRNDVGQDVLWYNANLMTQFGYTVPTTWQQWAALGQEVATQHPGYIIGEAGSSGDDEIYFQASQCPVNQVVNSTTVDIDPSSPNCTRMVNLLDPLIKDGALTTEGVFTSTFDQQYAGKVLMMIGPSWYGQYLFGSTTGLNVPAGQMAAAVPLKWQGASTPTTGDYGGGVWIVSSHAKNAKLAASFATWVATNPAYQATAPTYPAYVPDDSKWIAAVDKSKYFANNVEPAFAAGAREIWTKWDVTRYSTDTAWGNTEVPALTGGATMASAFAAFTAELSNLAISDGYVVVNKP